MNELIFILHCTVIGISTLIALRMSKYALAAFVCLLGILANLFITKQIQLFGMTVVATDAFVVGSILGLQLLQEYYGKTITRKTIAASFFLLMFYGIACNIHLMYIPSQFDTAHPHFVSVLQHMPRIIIASIAAYLCSQIVDYQAYAFLKRVFLKRFLFIRSIISLTLSQIVDTTLFSFLALYGIIESVGSVILMSFAIKMVVILFITPFVTISKKFAKKQP